MAGDLATMPDIVLESETSLHEAMEVLSGFVGITVPIVDDRHHMKLLGVIFENSVIGAHNEAVKKARNEERGLALFQQSGTFLNCSYEELRGRDGTTGYTARAPAAAPPPFSR